MANEVYIGLDFETTGLDPLKHVPLTLGLAWENGDQIETNEFQFDFFAPRRWDAEAMFVNKLHPATSRTEPMQEKTFIIPPEGSDYHDWRICQFLMRMGWSPFDKKLVPVGWNVGGFDMRFFNTFFPQASKFFSHRYLELNSLCYAADAAGLTIKAKEWCKSEVIKICDEEEREQEWHSAEFDAWASLVAKQQLDGLFIDNTEER